MSDSEDGDSHLLVDWKGDGGEAGGLRRQGVRRRASFSSAVQQTIGYKKVKQQRCSSPWKPEMKPEMKKVVEDDGKCSTVPADIRVQPTTIVLVSLSESEPSEPVVPPPRAAAATIFEPLKPATNVVCLDTDSDSEVSVSHHHNPKSFAKLQVLDDLTGPKSINDKAETGFCTQTDRTGMYSSFKTPPRPTSGDSNCTLDPCGSSGLYSPAIDTQVVASSSKRHDLKKNGSSGKLSSISGGGDVKWLELSEDEEQGSFLKDSLNPDEDDVGVPGRRAAADLEVSPIIDVRFSSTKDLLRSIPPCELPSMAEPQSVEVGEDENRSKRRKGKTGKRAVCGEERELGKIERLQAREAEKLRKAAEREERKLQKEESKRLLQEEKQRKREEEKLRKEAAKIEAKEKHKAEQELDRWEKGKSALQNTMALIDTKVVESGLIGGQLLSRLGEKQLQFQLMSNAVEKSILWRMKRPSVDCLVDSQSQFWDPEDTPSQGEALGSQLVLEEIDVPYILFVLEAEEFAVMVGENKLHTHIVSVQARYPGFTICYLVNKLKWFLQKKDQAQYKNGESGWKCPPVEQALVQMVTNYNGVHSRLCLDEAEVADHVAGLMRSLAECPFKQKLTPLSVSKNGDHVAKSDPNKEEIKKSLWLKALVALPKTSGAIARAIAKEYPSMRALLNAYLDSAKSVHEKELLLQNLMREGLFGAEQARRIGPACSRRIYRILMAQNGSLKTDDVEQGADHFRDD
ncbi:hypothetical protein CY35_12G076600 [Sphagnum magellanicum]|nr:hypothetical protein CY35_12G076600 [Sphagnum magellanicum]